MGRVFNLFYSLLRIVSVTKKRTFSWANEADIKVVKIMLLLESLSHLNVHFFDYGTGNNTVLLDASEQRSNGILCS
jgi:hypothetical protein